MELTLTQAIAALSDSQYNSLDGLRNLASQVSVKVPGAASDAVTLLYSGGMQPDGMGGTVSMANGGPQAWQLAKPIADVSGNKVIVIDKTPSAEFLNDPRFIDKLNSILNPTGSMGDAELTAARNNALFGTVENGIRTEGFFDDTSRRLVQAAPGDIKTLSPFANGTSTFTQVELREILLGTNSNIQNIDGIPKEQYLRLYNDTLTRTGNATQALEDVRAAVSAKSWVNALELEYRVGTSYAVEVGTGKFFADSPQISSHVITEGIPRTAVGSLMETMSPSQWDGLRAGELALSRGSSLTAALEVGGRFLNKMGVAGALLGLAITANDANAAYAEGDTTKAKQILGDWALDFAGGMAGGLLAAELMGSALAPLYLTGPAGAIIAGGLTLMAGVFGGLAGEHYVHSFADAISNLVNSLTTAALNWVAPRRDPLVLDLDGNGITTSAINPLAPILFDQDGDGTKTATGWIASGEAIVVRDLNGNGSIDSGRELFGDNTILTQGPRGGQTAANGFEALADLDSNADGKFDANDAAFASVKLWKDANQNGTSEAGELFTFADLGVASINVSGTATNINLGGGNTQTHSGSFTKVGSAVGSAGTAELAGSLLLANNNFYREFSDDPALTAEAQALPEMQGSGAVRDMRAAMSLGTAQAAMLQTKLQKFAQGATRAQQMADLDALIQSWGNTSAMQTSLPSGFISTGGDQRLTALWQFSQSKPTMYAKITALERFNDYVNATKTIAACAGNTRATTTFTCESKALRQSSRQMLCSPNLPQYGLRCVRSDSSRRALRHQYKCSAVQTQITKN